MEVFHLLFFYIVLLMFFSSSKFFAYGVGSHFHVIQVKPLPTPSTCSSASHRGPRKLQPHKLKLTHRYGPCSPLTNERNSPPTSHQIFLQDQSRVLSINSRTPSNNNMQHLMGFLGDGTRLPVFGRSIGMGNFVVSIGLGTPKRDYPLIFDTGSSITWVRCQPFTSPSQQSELYDPSSSSSYSNVSCPPSPTTCPYEITYEDGSHSKGYFIRDTLTMTPSDVFQNFVFGCDQENFGKDGKDDFGTAAGLLGVGYDDTDSFSLLARSAEVFSLIFCYCLPPTENSSGYLLFGTEAINTCKTDNYTPLINDKSHPSLYFVNLVSITLGNQSLQISPFRTIIDSGTVISRLPVSVYSILKAAFVQTMSQYPPAAPSGIMDSCYNLEAYKNVTIPTMTLRFEGSRDVNIDPSGIIWRESESQVCLAFAGNTDTANLSIIGNHQQRTLNILYNIQEKKVGFNGRGC